MIALPPVVEGAVQLSATVPCPAVAPSAAGAPAVESGVPLADADAAPAPAAFTARSPTAYVVPLTRPVMTSGLAVDAGLRELHVAP